MIALEKMVKVSAVKTDYVPAQQWGWKPVVGNLDAINKSFVEASGGGTTTSRVSGGGTTDHGELY